MAKYMALAIAEGWNADKLAKAAKVDPTTAMRELNYHRTKVHQLAEKSLVSIQPVLVKEAQTAKKAALEHLEKLRSMTSAALEHVAAMAPSNGKHGVPVELDEFGQPVPFNAKDFAAAVKTAQQTARDLLKFADEVTGVDVVKQIAVRTNSDKEGKLLTWDGINALTDAISSGIVHDVDQIESHALPASKSQPDDCW